MDKVKSCEVKKTTFIWNVRYPIFSPACDICSPSFSVDAHGITRYCLNFVSKRELQGYTFNYALHLKKHELDCEPNAVVFNLKVTVTGSNMDDDYVLEHVKFSNNTVLLLEKSIVVNTINFRNDYNVTFCLEVEPDDNFLEKDDLWACNNEDLELLSKDIAKALDIKEFCDLTFRSIEGKPVKLHKVIFECRYPNFAKALGLFENPKQEYNLEIDFKGICVLLQYLYSGKICVSKSTYGVHELLKRAKLFHLQHLLYPIPRIVHASTTVPLKSGSFVWLIPESNLDSDDEILTNNFCCDDFLEWTKLRIIFYTRENANNESCIGFKIQRTEQTRKLHVMCIIEVENNELFLKSFEHRFETDREFVIYPFMTETQINEHRTSLLVHGFLKLRFELRIYDLNEVNEYDMVQYLEINGWQNSSTVINLWALRKDLARLYLNASFSDITIQTGQLLIPAHKVILSTRSPEFSRILQEDFPENATIEINNYDEETVLQILSYIYFGEVNSESKNFEWAANLYRASHEYQLVYLTQKCVSYIEAILDELNIYTVLVLADDYQDEYLKGCATSFVLTHYRDISGTENWKKIETERPHLLLGILNIVLG